jgi:hypothetical protein
MRKKMVLVLAGLVVGGAAATLSSASAATTLTVIEHADTDHLTDIGKTGFSPGDLLTFHNTIYDSTNTNVVGSDQGSCIRITKFRENLSGSWECEWTTTLNNGADSITVESPFFDTGLGVGAITGGTGAYTGASGSLDLSCTETECTFTFTLA